MSQTKKAKLVGESSASKLQRVSDAACHWWLTNSERHPMKLLFAETPLPTRAGARTPEQALNGKKVQALFYACLKFLVHKQSCGVEEGLAAILYWSEADEKKQREAGTAAESWHPAMRNAWSTAPTVLKVAMFKYIRAIVLDDIRKFDASVDGWDAHNADPKKNKPPAPPDFRLVSYENLDSHMHRFELRVMPLLLRLTRALQVTRMIARFEAAVHHPTPWQLSATGPVSKSAEPGSASPVRVGSHKFAELPLPLLSRIRNFIVVDFA